MFGKMILPVFGGAPAVWITSLVFFQLMLLAGYLYVHVTLKWLGPRRQAVTHAALLLLPLAVLPIRVMTGWGLTSPFRPITSVFLILLSSVGLPFFVVSTTAPLLQRWFGATGHQRAHDPFFLYAASNLGSLGALLAYPVVVEPLLRLDTQSRGWAVAYGLLVVLTLGSAVAVMKSVRAAEPLSERRDEVPSIPWRTRLRWIALAAVPSSLMLSVTTHITTDIAAVPLLWVIPLGLYLGTFVLAFAPRTMFLGRVAARMLPFFVVLPFIAIVSGLREPLGFVLFHLAALFLAAMVCHGELAASRPGVRHLTEFYVWLSIGGAVGGIFNVLVAPFVFRTEAEYPLGLVLACLLRPAIAPSSSDGRPLWRRDIPFAVVVGILVLALELGMQLARIPAGTTPFAVFVFATPLAIALMLRKRPIQFGLALGAIALVAWLYPDWSQSVVAKERSFYGVHSIANRMSYRVLLHGTTNHGAQSLRPPRRCVPLTYYYPTGPLGQLFSTFMGDYAKSNIGIVGLGTGSTAGYAQPQQRWTFYEIDPAIERIARNPRYFTFLRDCAPQARVVLGDARISLAREPDGVHDVIVFDAFSSDAIPVHLLTREAMGLYLRKLAPRGVMAFHISNRYVNLRRVLARLARDGNLVAYVRTDQDVTPLEAYEGKLASIWVVVARSAADFGPLTGDSRWLKLPADLGGRSWTDSYSNVLETLRLPGW